MENFVLNGNGQIDINWKRVDRDYKFHLQEINHSTEIYSNKDACDDTATSASSYSNYKQRIDAMFDDSRYGLTDVSKSKKKRKPQHHKSGLEINNERIIVNNIQEKIEKMFEDISIGVQRHDSSTSGSDPERATKNFAVTYLGSKCLFDKNISLISLQDPLKQLYFEFRKNPPGDQIHALTIFKEGLKIKIEDKQKLNLFPTIAVWASVKLSFRVTQNKTEYAFLPLVTGSDGIDKNLLFKELKAEDKQYFKDQINEDNQSPIFTVVMKNLNMNKQLECHGFICKSSEEAILIAANLYQALMEKLKRKKQRKEQKLTKDIAVGVHPTEENRIKPKVKVKKPAPPVPQIPNEKEKCPTLEPCKKDNIVKVEESEKVVKTSQRRGSTPSTRTEPVRTLRRTVSERGENSLTIRAQNDGGDILTRVAIPRSRSFLNANGPLSRFSVRNKTNPKNEVVSPLGLKELFHEFQIHEGLESMDDILNTIIDAEGMSFNDLKPIYKEFLLKLAVTLTKDELYQKSKLIMRRQKKRNKNFSFKKRTFISPLSLNKFFERTVNKLGKTKIQRSTNLEFTSIVFQSTNKHFDSNLPNIKKRKTNWLRVKRRQRLAKRLEKTKNKHVSTSEDSDFFQQQRNRSDSGGGPNRSSSGYFSCSECSWDSEKCICTRTDKCYCNLGNKKNYGASSCDEIQFPPRKFSFHLMPEKSEDHEPEDSLKSCSCDTDSCINSGKCYCTQKKGCNKTFHLSDSKKICQTPHLHQKDRLHKDSCPYVSKTSCKKYGEPIFEFKTVQNSTQFETPGFVSSGSIFSRAASLATAWQSNERSVKQNPRLKAASNLEYLNSGRQHYPDCEKHLLNEIQSTCQEQKFLEDCLCFHEATVRSNFFAGGSRQYSSMRCRSEFINPSFSPLQRSVSYRTKNLFNSVRSKHSCDSVMNHIKFPDHANSSLRFTQRMDVYNSSSSGSRRPFWIDGFICHSYFKENRRHSLTQNDLFNLNRGNLQKLHYDFLGKPTCETPDPKTNNKVLVVSARDPKGKILYMGTNSRCESSFNLNNFPENTRSNASEALAVKKSAEIAALFSDVRPKLKSDLDHVKEQKQNNYRARSNSYKSTNLENTLGYLP